MNCNVMLSAKVVIITLLQIKTTESNCNQAKSLEVLPSKLYINSTIGYVTTELHIPMYLESCSLVSIENVDLFPICSYNCLSNDNCIAMIYKKDIRLCEICVTDTLTTLNFILLPSYNLYIYSDGIDSSIQGNVIEHDNTSSGEKVSLQIRTFKIYIYLYLYRYNLIIYCLII